MSLSRYNLFETKKNVDINNNQQSKNKESSIWIL